MEILVYFISTVVMKHLAEPAVHEKIAYQLDVYWYRLAPGVFIDYSVEIYRLYSCHA